jgi:hypothetical protein
VRLCYPAKNITDDIDNKMTASGWSRLSYDPYNPWISPNSGLSKWFPTMGRDYFSGYKWLEYWEDGEKNIIEYQLKSRLQKHGDIISDEECSLMGISTYIPEDLMRAIQEEIKGVEKEERERARKEIEGRRK